MSEVFRQSGYGFREQVVDDMVAFRMQLVQKQSDLVFDLIVRVLKKLAYVYYLPFKFEHIIQDEVGNHHQSLLSHVVYWVMKQHKYLFGFVIHYVGESVKQIPDCDDNVRFHSEVNWRF